MDSLTERDLMERGLQTAKDMLADIEAGQPGVDPVFKLHNAEPYLMECISWLERELGARQAGDDSGPNVICESYEEAKASTPPRRVPCSPVEYGILISSVTAEERKIAFSKERGRPGTVIGDYAKVGVACIASLKKELAIYFPVEGYCRPGSSTVMSVGRGG